MKMFKIKNSTKGFTLIELLVVIAIIGILSSVVLASLNSARKSGRDAKRVADIKQIQLALELYFDANMTTGYPTTLGPLVTAGYIPILPKDPSTNIAYGSETTPFYAALGSGSSCTSYHLAATLESDASLALKSKVNATAGSICTGSAADFNGTGTLIYDVKP